MLGIKLLHFSVDDVIVSFKQLTETNPISIFEIPMFSYLKKMHEKYGVVVSCYCFYTCGDFTLSNATRQYRQEFENNSSWLKFSFHGNTGRENYEEQDLKMSQRQFQDVICNLKEIVEPSSLDSFARIHTFQASHNFVRFLAQNEDYSLKGLLSADDSRISYSLSKCDNAQLKLDGWFQSDGLALLKTTQRFDSLRPSSLKRLFVVGGQVLLFTHEWIFYPQQDFNLAVRAKLIKLLMNIVFRFYKKENYYNVFPIEILKYKVNG